MATPIILESMHGANIARVAAPPLASGTLVSTGQLLFEIENHKVVQEVESPADGLLVHGLVQGDLLQLGQPIAFIAAEGDDQTRLLEASNAAKAPDGVGWEAMIAGNVAGGAPAGAKVSIAKATEIAVLGNGAGNSLAASLGASVGPIRRSAATPAFFKDKILDLLVYEAARLLTEKRFRVLNSCFADGAIVPHERIKPGISFDEGKRLTLYAMADVETLSLSQVQDAIVGGLMKYVGQKLSLEDVATSTFTISDVSAVPLSFTVPLLPQGQCFIIAVNRDEGGCFGLNMTFDHRITEGLVAANFAQELIKRIRSYAVLDSQPVHSTAGSAAAVCSFCERSVEEEIGGFKRRGLLKIVDGSHGEVLCCTACWEGW